MSDFYIASGAPKTNTSAKAVDGLTYFFGADGYSYKFTFGGTNKTATEDCITDAVKQ